MSHEYKYAVNVKSQVGYHNAPEDFDTIGEKSAEIIWEQYAESFWIEASEIAHEHGYAGVYQEGRSGGWLVPVYSATAHTRSGTRSYTVSQWLEDCYEHEEAEHAARFEKFKAAIQSLQQDFEADYLQAIHEAAVEEQVSLEAARDSAIVRGEN